MGRPGGAEGGEVGAEPMVRGLAQPELAPSWCLSTVLVSVHCPGISPLSWRLSTVPMSVCPPPGRFSMALPDPSSINSCGDVEGERKCSLA